MLLRYHMKTNIKYCLQIFKTLEYLNKNTFYSICIPHRIYFTGYENK